MDRLNTKLKIRQVVDVLMCSTSSFSAIRRAVLSLQEIMAEATEYAWENPRQCRISESNKDEFKHLIAPLNFSMLDLPRTTQFLRGLISATNQLNNRFDHETLHLAYAGCGPLAFLMLPLTVLYTPAQLRITLIDQNAETLKLLNELFDYLGVEAYIEQSICEDPATYTSVQHYHLILADAITRGLENSAHVKVMSHMVEYLKPDGLIIPERIALKACLVSQKSQYIHTPLMAPHEKKELGTVFEFDTQTARLVNRLMTGQDALTLDPAEIEVPAYDAEQKELNLLTHITVFGDIKLQDYDSSMTLPITLNLGDKFHQQHKLAFAYNVGQNSALEYAFKD